VISGLSELTQHVKSLTQILMAVTVAGVFGEWNYSLGIGMFF